jgi:hypothetical protein
MGSAMTAVAMLSVPIIIKKDFPHYCLSLPILAPAFFPTTRRIAKKVRRFQRGASHRNYDFRHR